MALGYDDGLGGLFEIPICLTPATAFLDGVSTCIWDGKEMKFGAFSDSTNSASVEALAHNENGSESRLDGLYRMSATTRRMAYQSHWKGNWV